MKQFSSRYINPFTDFGFKKLFGEEVNKDLLIDFLNELLPQEQGQISDLTYLKNSQLGRNDAERLAIFDLYCVSEKGETFIVELQQAYQEHFKDRAIYYSTFPIRNQSKKGEWNYELKKIYTIAILDFTFKDSGSKIGETGKVKSVIKLSDVETNEIFYDKLTFIYLEMPRFTKTLNQLESRFEKWLYILRNLEKLESIPKRLQEKIFMKVFETAEIAKFSSEEADSYEDSLKSYRDYTNTINSAYNEGKNEGKVLGIQEGTKRGILKGKKERDVEIASNAIKKNFPISVISELTGLSENEVLRIRDEIS